MDKNHLLKTLNQLKSGEILNPIQVQKEQYSRNDIAIIGIGLRLPHAKNLDEFYQVLVNKTDCVSYPQKRRYQDIVRYLNYRGIAPDSYKLKEAAYLAEIDQFDYSFFKISFKEACLMDPYQRIFLETVWHTFEDAGYTRENLQGTKTGVYVGQPLSTEYYQRVKAIEPELALMAGPGNIDSIIAGRISYMYDLRGPSMLVNTACSSTLTAIHLACQSLKNQECTMALVGGINILIEPVQYLDEEVPAILSSTARARTFSDDSDGTGYGEGCIAILLKPLEKALKDKDNIHAVIKGSASNNDGSSVGVTAPNLAAQEEVIATAWQNAKISPETIGYIEAHGTGTTLGDPIEIDALTHIFQRYTDKRQFCGIGAVKTNYGHLDSAAGLIGLVKAVVSLQKQKLLPTINFLLPNQQIDFITSPLYVVDELMEWNPPNDYPRRLGVSAFGLSGTNCHLVLEEAPQMNLPAATVGLNILTISAKSENKLREQIQNYLQFINHHPETDLADMCYTTQVGREHYTYRVAIILGTEPLKLNAQLAQFLQEQKTRADLGIYYSHSKTTLMQTAGVMSQSSANEVLTIVNEYINGGQINWDKYYATHRRKRISLPGYSFANRRCWIEVPEITPQENQAMRGDLMTDTKPVERDIQILDDLQVFVANMFALEPAEVDPDLDYFDLGIDSISIIQLKQEVKNAYGIEISAEKLFGELSTLRRLAEYIEDCQPEEVVKATQKVKTSATTSINSEYTASLGTSTTVQQQLSTHGANLQNLNMSQQLVQSNNAASVYGQNDVVNLIQSQLEIMSQQLQLMQSFGEYPPKLRVQSTELEMLDTQNSRQSKESADSLKAQDKSAREGSPDQGERLLQKFIVKSPPILNSEQKQFLHSLIARYEEKTVNSKKLTQQYRKVWANGRTTQGYSKQWKEIIYPILSKKGRGSRIWDVDDNEYIDFAMGFGVNLFGYNHPVIREAVHSQLTDGVILGSLTELAGEVAELISELTGVERVAFANSGTEAVMNLLRIARGTTGREKIAVFAGAFHGTFDGVYMMKNASQADEHPIPLSLGTPKSMAEDVIILDYGEKGSLELIRRYADELAAVLVEPVQSRNPDLQPREFLQELRQLTEELGIVLIFDEVITGFRIHPGGAQAYFDIEADLVSYGKVIGGGLPIGIFAGKAKYMDKVDGGMWQYGDQSSPSGFLVQTGGTFCHHPLAMSAAKATLQMLKTAGDSLQKTLNQKTDGMVRYLNTFFSDSEIDLQVANFGSQFIFKTNTPILLRFLYYMLIQKGFYLWEGATCFISTEHSVEDIAAFVRGIQEACAELAENNCFAFKLPAKLPEMREIIAEITDDQHLKSVIRSLALINHPKDLKKAEELFATDSNLEAIYPLSPMQELILAQNLNYNSTGYDNSLVRYVIYGVIDLKSFQKAWQIVVARHGILRTGFLWRRLKEPLQVVYNSLELPFEVIDLSELESEKQLHAYEEYISKERLVSFRLTNPPLIKFILIKFADDNWRFVLKYWNSLFDGWSSNQLFAECMEIYEKLTNAEDPVLNPPTPFINYISWLREQDSQEAKEFWLNELKDLLPVQNESENGHQIRSAFDGGEYMITLSSEEFSQIKEYARGQRVTLYTFLQGVWAVLQCRVAKQTDLLIGTICSGRPEELQDVNGIVGLFSNVLPIRISYQEDRSFSIFLKELQEKNLRLQKYEHTTIHQIANWSGLPVQLIQDAIYNRVLVYLNYPMKAIQKSQITISLEYEASHVNVPFRVYVEPFDGFRLVARYDRYYYDEERTAQILHEYKALIMMIAEGGDIT